MEPKKDLPRVIFEKILKEQGALRVSENAVDAFVDQSEKHIQEIANAARKYAHHAKRKTILAQDIELALKEFEH